MLDIPIIEQMAKEWNLTNKQQEKDKIVHPKKKKKDSKY